MPCPVFRIGFVQNSRMENEFSIEKLHVQRAVDGTEGRIIKREIGVINFEPRWRERERYSGRAAK